MAGRPRRAPQSGEPLEREILEGASNGSINKLFGKIEADLRLPCQGPLDAPLEFRPL